MMNHLKKILFVLFVGFGAVAFGQNEELLSSVPEKAEEYKATEANVIATVNWLDRTAIGTETDKRKEQSAYLIAWISGSPTVTLELNAYIMDYTKKNSDLLISFMGGWTKYALENDYSKDAVQGNLAGIRSMIAVYTAGGDIKKDKSMQALVDIDKSGELEDWVKKQID